MNTTEILQRKQNGTTIQEIAKEKGVSTKTIYQQLRRSGNGLARPGKNIRPEIQRWLDTKGKRLEKEFIRLLELCIIHARVNGIPIKDIGVERLMLFCHDGRISLEGEVEM